MRACSFGAFVLAFGLLGACGGHGPSAPSGSTPGTASGSGIAATQGIVAAAVSRAAMDTAMTVSPDALSRTLTSSCPNGGSMSITWTSAGAGTSSTFTSSSRIEFTGCRSQTVTINGEPAILMDMVSTFERTPGGALSSSTSTARTTGGLRFDAPGSSGRARYDCTMVMSIPFGSGGIPGEPTITYSGTMTWEQPLGTVSVRACGT